MSGTLTIQMQQCDWDLEALLAIEAAAPRETSRPESLILAEIHPAPQVFQWRMENDSLLADGYHIKELARALNAQSEPLEPILVTPIGARFFLVDGYHRLEAYRLAGWEKPIPVSISERCVEDARIEALTRNNQDKLPMSLESKLEAAWKLHVPRRTSSGSFLYSKSTIRKLTTVSDGMIGKMRRAIVRDGIEPSENTWRQAKGLKWQDENQEFDADEWKELKSREIADKLMSSIKTNLTGNPDIFARAIEMISPQLPRALIAQWLHEASEVVQEHQADLALDI